VPIQTPAVTSQLAILKTLQLQVLSLLHKISVCDYLQMKMSREKGILGFWVKA
jgi:hypothetical protein